MNSKLHDILHWLAFGLLGAALLAGCALTYTLYYYDTPGPLTEERTVLFKRGDGFLEIVDNLANEGVIRHPGVFKMIAVTLGDARKFKAGEYHFSTAISPRLVMEMIAEGRVVVHKITVAEGLRSQEVVELLKNEKLLEGDITINVKEGSLLPETYHYVYGDSRQEILNRMQVGMSSLLADLWEKRQEGLPFSTPQEAVTLASIVERETGVKSERGQVASVFVNRLKKNMRLQSDPTVIYAVEKDKGPLGRLLVQSDLAYESPYNTYRVAGLPPGPIANPGRAALEAVLNPPLTDYLYFVATGTGGHNFSASLKSHNDNVKEYRKVQHKADKAKPAAKAKEKLKKKKK